MADPELSWEERVLDVYSGKKGGGGVWGVGNIPRGIRGVRETSPLNILQCRCKIASFEAILICFLEMWMAIGGWDLCTPGAI